jgi:hypothetical protein
MSSCSAASPPLPQPPGHCSARLQSSPRCQSPARALAAGSSAPPVPPSLTAQPAPPARPAAGRCARTAASSSPTSARAWACWGREAPSATQTRRCWTEPRGGGAWQQAGARRASRRTRATPLAGTAAAAAGHAAARARRCRCSAGSRPVRRPSPAPPAGPGPRAGGLRCPLATAQPALAPGARQRAAALLPGRGATAPLRRAAARRARCRGPLPPRCWRWRILQLRSCPQAAQWALLLPRRAPCQPAKSPTAAAPAATSPAGRLCQRPAAGGSAAPAAAEPSPRASAGRPAHGARGRPPAAAGPAPQRPAPGLPLHAAAASGWRCRWRSRQICWGLGRARASQRWGTTTT